MDDLAQAVSAMLVNSKVLERSSAVAPKLEKAIMNETSGAIKIIVGSADVCEDLYNAAKDGSGDVVGSESRWKFSQRTSCERLQDQSDLEGLLQALQLGLRLLQVCSHD